MEIFIIFIKNQMLHRLISKRMIGMNGVKCMEKLQETRKGRTNSENLPYKELFFQHPDALFLLNSNGEFIEVNHGLEKLTGYSKNELLYTHFSRYVYIEDFRRVLRYFHEILEGNSEEREFRIVDKFNHIKYIRITVIAANIKEDFSCVYGGAKDITGEKQLETAMLHSENRFEALIQNSSDVIGILDENGIMKYQSRAVEQTLGYTPEQMIGISGFDFIYHEDLPILNRLFDSALNTPDETVTAEFRINKANNECVYCEVKMKNLLHVEHINGVVVNYRDISDRKKYEKEIQHLAFHDYLTGLPNRNMLEHILVNKMTSQSKMALLFIDLDRFKVINDSLGHSVGDLLLRMVSERLKSAIGESDLLFRQGGDEFLILLDFAGRQIAVEAAEKVLDSFSFPFMIQDHDIFVSPSIGISFFPVDGGTFEHLIKHADYAMYQAKKSGGNMYHFYSTTDNVLQVNPLKMEMELHKAIERNELRLHYQPKLHLKTGAVIGVEALIRWFHPEFGMVPPARFIPLAEETGLIIPIGKWALQAACAQNKKWQDQGLNPMVVSVNLSIRQFSQANLVQTVAQILEETGLESHYLELEVTESMTANIEYTLKTLQQLKDLGVRISIDDFGTGFSSLNYLKEFPVDTLKIDQSFVRELHNNPNDQTIVKTIISMARNLNLNVVAEGIETREQLVFLQQYFCHEGQGYFFSKPLPAEDISKMMSDIETIIPTHGISQKDNDKNWDEEMVRVAKTELQNTLRRQQGLTLKFEKINGKLIHTLCEGELIYRLGILPEEVVGRELSEILPQEAAVEKERHYQRAWNGEEHVTYEAVLNGVHYMAALRPIRRGGRVVEVIASCVDITSLKNTEKALRVSEEKYRLIAENVSDMISILDPEGCFLYASTAYEKVLDIKSDLLEGSNYLTIIHPEDIDLVITQFTHMLETKKSFNNEIRMKHSTGEWIVTESSFTPITNGDNQLKQIVVIARDVTEKRQAEDLLWKFEKLSLVGELAAGVAHEIRNPITTIKGFVQLFQQGMFKEEYCQIIMEEFHQLDEIMNHFLLLAKPQANKLAVSDPLVIIESVLSKLREEADLKKVQIDIDVDEKRPFILCDQTQIRLVFMNLVQNSLEAMPNGGTVKIKLNTENGYLVIKVIDQGKGISQERIDKLGEPFYSNKEKGTGLGFMISYRIVSDHKGMITVVSDKDKGTTVEVKLPTFENSNI